MGDRYDLRRGVEANHIDWGADDLRYEYSSTVLGVSASFLSVSDSTSDTRSFHIVILFVPMLLYSCMLSHGSRC